MRLSEVQMMSDSSDIMDIDRGNKKGKRRGYIKHAKIRGLAHKNCVNKYVPEQSTDPDCKCRLSSTAKCLCKRVSILLNELMCLVLKMNKMYNKQDV